MSDLIQTEWPRPGVLLVRLNRPEALNAMNADLIEALHAVLAEVRHDSEVRALVLTGNGKAFCAGLDLRGYGTPPGAAEGEGRPQAGLRVQQHIASLVEAFRGVRAPVIAAVNGAAAGGGMALALMADIRIMADTAALHAAFIKRGLSNCDIGVSWLLPRMIGFSRAAQILLTGRSVDAAEAERIGIVSSVEPADRLLEAALEAAEAIAGNSPFGVWMTKEVMWSNLEVPSLRAAIDLENRTQILSAMTKDHREAVHSFLEKRPPVYRNH
ncbi:enoyl-CoA hydratase-related protein [Nocardia carnea]|uniref:enoyl-CoA hydratase-related protein n=1 Tax=Nocardia carnea TaxID=37328 RepID=UPI002457C70C|nr:enoyl-CoA hydratase-related protein [Nocardia carnea]